MPMSPEDKKEEEKKVGATSALHKITQTGYTSLDVSHLQLIGGWNRYIFLSAYPLLHLWT